MVIKNNETLLINESQYNRKRRSTRCQKRYNDDLFYDEIGQETSLEPLPLAQPTPAPTPQTSSPGKEKDRKVYVYEDTVDKIKEFSIIVPKFDFLGEIAPWCIYHNSYKCNCKNNMNLRSKRSLENTLKNGEGGNETVAIKPGPKRRSNVKSEQPEKKLKEEDTEATKEKEETRVIAQMSQR